MFGIMSQISERLTQYQIRVTANIHLYVGEDIIMKYTLVPRKNIILSVRFVVIN